MFDRTLEHPFSLAVGSIDKLRQNLVDLKTAPQPKEQVAFQLWTLVRIGYPMHRLVKVLLLIQDLPWTTKIAEQMNAIAGVLMRFHPGYGLDKLLCRAMINMMNRILSRPGDDEKQVNELMQEMRRCEGKNPEIIRGRNICFRDLIAAAARRT